MIKNLLSVIAVASTMVLTAQTGRIAKEKTLTQVFHLKTQLLKK